MFIEWLSIFVDNISCYLLCFCVFFPSQPHKKSHKQSSVTILKGRKFNFGNKKWLIIMYLVTFLLNKKLFQSSLLWNGNQSSLSSPLVWGADYFLLVPSRQWGVVPPGPLIWDKPSFSACHCRSLNGPLQVCDSIGLSLAFVMFEKVTVCVEAIGFFLVTPVTFIGWLSGIFCKGPWISKIK